METEELPDFLKKGHLKKLPFKVPEGYFEHLPSQLSNRLELETKPELKEPEMEFKLNQTVPDGYFEQLPTLISNRLDKILDKKEPKIVPIGNSWKMWSIAASIAIVLISGLGLLWNNQQKNQSLDIALETTEIENYLLESPWNDQPELLSMLASQQTLPSSQDWVDQIKNEEIENQLEADDYELFTN